MATPPNNQGYSVSDDEFLSSEFIDDEIISKLSSLDAKKMYKSYADIYSGGVTALSPKNRKDNKDWMSQSANSFREIFYCLQESEGLKTEQMLNEFLGKTLTDTEVSNYRSYLASCYQFFIDITHHFVGVEDLTEREYILSPVDTFRASELSQENYLRTVKIFKEHTKILITTAIEIHGKIDFYIKQKIQDVDSLKVLINNSYDARAYFYSKIDETWLQWLIDNNFFNPLRQKSENTKEYTYRTPELTYLNKVTEKAPDLVEKVISIIKISEVNFNPEVIDRFLWIIGELPSKNIISLTKKIKDERWLYLMHDFSRSGYDHQRIVEKLATAGEWNSLNEFSEALLEIKSSDDFNKVETFYNDTPFYTKDINHSQIYEKLSDVDTETLPQTLKILRKRIIEAHELSVRDCTGIFLKEDIFVLYDKDIFSIKIEKADAYEHRQDVDNIIALYKFLIEKYYKNNSEKDYIDFYNTDIKTLPDTRTFLRLKLFVMTRYPVTLKADIRDALFKVFEAGDRYYDLVGCDEYNKTLQLSFFHLIEDDRRIYIEGIFDFFCTPSKDKDDDFYRKNTASKILSYVVKDLTPEENELAEKIFGKKIEDIEHDTYSKRYQSRGGTVNHRSPIEITKLTGIEILEKVKNELKVSVLKDTYKDDDFLNPRGAEGLGEELQKDIKNRPEEYFDLLPSFFDRENIDAHYSYSLLRGVEEMMREPRTPLGEKRFNKVIDTFSEITLSGMVESFTPKSDKSWLADWITVHRAMSDILVQAIGNGDLSYPSTEKRKAEILEIIDYLLFSVKQRPESSDREKTNDPYTTAINSVNGRAFQALVELIHKEGKNITLKTKELFEKVLEEKSVPVRFLIGHLLAHPYYADPVWLKGLLPKIFSKDDLDVYLATWEGYVCGTLYKELFDELTAEYEYSIGLTNEKYPDRKYYRDFDESLADQMALAFIYLGLKIEDPLFINFWKNSSSKRREGFISLIGRHSFTRAQAGDEWLDENKVDKVKLVNFWEWVITVDKSDIDTETYTAFGYWINQYKEIIEYSKIAELLPETLRMTTGNNFWEYGFLPALSKLVTINPEQTLEIVRYYFFDRKGNLRPNSFRSYQLSEISDALSALYLKEELKIKVKNLINSLVEKGGQPFWVLEKVLE